MGVRARRPRRPGAARQPCVATDSLGGHRTLPAARLARSGLRGTKGRARGARSRGGKPLSPLSLPDPDKPTPATDPSRATADATTG